MLRKAARLRAQEVRNTISRGKTSRGKVLSLKYLETFSPLRVAVVVSKKLARTAVARNRLRRAVYRALSEVSPMKRGHAILFVQSIPKDDLTPAFAADIKTLLHV